MNGWLAGFELYSLLEKGLHDIDKGAEKPADEVFSRIEGRLKNG